MKKTILILLLAVVVITSGYGLYILKNKNNKNVGSEISEIRIGHTVDSLTSAAVVIAYENGYFQKHNLQPKIVLLKNGKEVAQAMAAGQVDIGMGGIANFAPAMAKGAPMRFIAASAASPSYIFVRPDANIKNFSDLYGKTISLQSNGINDLIFRTAMGQEKIDTKKMKFVEIERAFNVTALMDKKVVDAAVVADQDVDMFLKAGAIILPEWVIAGYSKKAEPRNSVAVDSNFLNRHEVTVRNFLNAYIEAQRFIKENPEKAAITVADSIKKNSGGAVSRDPETIASQWQNKKTINMLWQDPAITMDLVHKSKEIGSIDKELLLEDVYDLRFAKELKIAQEEIYGPEN